jgi:hypothetical protein
MALPPIKYKFISKFYLTRKVVPANEGVAKAPPTTAMEFFFYIIIGK